MDPDSPISGWGRTLIEKSLRSYATGKQYTRTLKVVPFTLKSFEPWFFDGVLAPLLPSLETNSIMWVGITQP